MFRFFIKMFSKVFLWVFNKFLESANMQKKMLMITKAKTSVRKNEAVKSKSKKNEMSLAVKAGWLEFSTKGYKSLNAL